MQYQNVNSPCQLFPWPAKTKTISLYQSYKFTIIIDLYSSVKIWIWWNQLGQSQLHIRTSLSSFPKITQNSPILPILAPNAKKSKSKIKSHNPHPLKMLFILNRHLFAKNLFKIDLMKKFISNPNQSVIIKVSLIASKIKNNYRPKVKI